MSAHTMLSTSYFGFRIIIYIKLLIHNPEDFFLLFVFKGPSYWTLYREPGYSSDWFTFCPGDYFGGTDFVDNTLESMKIMSRFMKGIFNLHLPSFVFKAKFFMFQM